MLDFYRLSDSKEHSFGRVFSGPQHFTDIRRNVAILHATRGDGGAGDNGRPPRGGAVDGGDDAWRDGAVDVDDEGLPKPHAETLLEKVRTASLAPKQRAWAGEPLALGRA